VTVCEAVSEVGPLTVAANCWLDAASMVTDVGLNVIETHFDCFVPLLFVLLFANASPPQEIAHMHASKIARKEGLKGIAHSNLDTTGLSALV
jgi:hypothetical protein